MGGVPACTGAGLAQANRGADIPRRAQADGCGSDVQDAGSERALQPVGRSDRVSGP